MEEKEKIGDYVSDLLRSYVGVEVSPTEVKYGDIEISGLEEEQTVWEIAKFIVLTVLEKSGLSERDLVSVLVRILEDLVRKARNQGCKQALATVNSYLGSLSVTKGIYKRILKEIQDILRSRLGKRC